MNDHGRRLHADTGSGAEGEYESGLPTRAEQDAEIVEGIVTLYYEMEGTTNTFTLSMNMDGDGNMDALIRHLERLEGFRVSPTTLRCRHARVRPVRDGEVLCEQCGASTHFGTWETT